MPAIYFFPGGVSGKEPNCQCKKHKRSLPMQEMWVRFLVWKDPLGEVMATHSGFLAWRIPWTEEPGGLQSTGSQRGRDD